MPPAFRENRTPPIDLAEDMGLGRHNNTLLAIESTSQSVYVMWNQSDALSEKLVH